MVPLKDRQIGSLLDVGLFWAGAVLILLSVFSDGWFRGDNLRFGLWSQFPDVEYSTSMANLKKSGNAVVLASLAALGMSVLLFGSWVTGRLRTAVQVLRVLAGIVGVLSATFFVSEVRGDLYMSWCFPLYLHGVTLVVLAVVLMTRRPSPTAG